MRKGIWNRSLAAAMAAAMVLGVCPARAQAETLPADAWYVEYVNYVTDKGIMSGTEIGFQPGLTTSRAMVYQTLYNMEKKPSVDGMTLKFDDAKGKWYEASATWAGETKLATGDGTGYNGDRAVTRAELATILCRYAEFKKMDVSKADDLKAFPDAASLPDWSKDAFGWAVAAGVINGKDGKLAPSDPSDRAQLAAVLTRFDKLGAEDGEEAMTVKVKMPSTDDIDKYGDVLLDITSGDFGKAGFKHADVVSVKFLDQEVKIPVVGEYNHVGAQASALVMWADADRPVELEVFNGSFAEKYGLVKKETDGNEKGYRYDPLEGVEFPVEVTITLDKAQGYADEFLAFSQTMTNERDDYKDLSDEEFANFREIKTTGMGEKKLYRSSSPIKIDVGRNEYADKAMEAAGIKSVVNLADKEDDPAKSEKKYPAYADTYYSKQNILFMNLGVDFSTDVNKKGVVDIMTFLADEKTETPVLIHCNEGKDRAGFVSALLECLMGATYEEVEKDYMATFYNYYGIKEGTNEYTVISRNIATNLTNAFGCEDIKTADLAKEAETYLKGLGVSDGTITAVKAKLGK